MTAQGQRRRRYGRGGEVVPEAHFTSYYGHPVIKAAPWEAPEGWQPGDPAVIETTLGRCLFNEALPADYRFVNYEVTKKELGQIVNDLAERYPKVDVAVTLDALKAAGFYWATRSGITIAIDDVVTPPKKSPQTQWAAVSTVRQPISVAVHSPSSMNSPTVGWRWSETPLVIFPSGCAGFHAANGVVVYRTDTSKGRLALADRRGKIKVVDDQSLFDDFSAAEFCVLAAFATGASTRASARTACSSAAILRSSASSRSFSSLSTPLHERQDGVRRHDLLLLVRDLDVPGDDSLRHAGADTLRGRLLRRLLLAGELGLVRVAGVHRLREP